MTRSSTPVAEAGAQQYDRDYYLGQCGGYRLFQETGGQQLDSLRSYALELAQLGPGMQALDVCCGRGELVAAAAQIGCTAAGIDFSADALLLASDALTAVGTPHSSVARMDALHLGFDSKSMDAVFMTDVVEHLRPHRLEQALLEVQRVLKPGGRLVVHTTPSKEFLAYGQHFWRLMCLLAGRPVPTVITEESEGRAAMHCNLHSRPSLDQALSMFENRRVWHAYSYGRESAFKRATQYTGTAAFLTRNLWAVAIQ